MAMQKAGQEMRKLEKYFKTKRVETEEGLFLRCEYQKGTQAIDTSNIPRERVPSLYSVMVAIPKIYSINRKGNQPQENVSNVGKQNTRHKCPQHAQTQPEPSKKKNNFQTSAGKPIPKQRQGKQQQQTELEIRQQSYCCS
ncbi:hypothetical protein CHS0354_019365 [Potamilus streckersoni]|uniref:Uncharacterized protein n=1 Tax=Potamilus streckersoni TaxID=2493646 RepID=A0AAE0SHJ3_9BIVA|nr:hypothetical protein CHS0354_019365 [Potamilus streckersoni]